jgi:23S rRNA (cytidine2498-2'-O)-methyltransferase
MNADALLCYCRAGFEPELAAELTERAALCGLPGYARTERNSGLVEFLGADAAALSRALPLSGRPAPSRSERPHHADRGGAGSRIP